MDATFQGYSAAQAVRGGGREPVARALVAARRRTLALADAYAQALAASSLQVPYDPARNPPLWELGHIGWFQEAWVGRNRERALGVRCAPEPARSPSLLAQADRWYDSGRVAHCSRWTLPLPDAAGTRAYLEAGLAQTLQLLDGLPAAADDDALYFFRLVALHEEMHAEAAVYMARALGVCVPAAALETACAGVGPDAADSAPGGVLRLPAQAFRLGSSGPGFAFDNELGGHELWVDAFEIDAEPVSWSRFLPFVAAGGYEQSRWWSSQGWAWRQQARPDLAALQPDPPTGLHAAPTRSLDAPARPLDAPAVHLSAFEAEAWCCWAGRRLPSEAEWECAALTAPGFRWGHQLGPDGVWEWTASPFQPYPGFQPHPYRDYSAPWFGSRRVLRGASAATAPVLAHPRYRNFFEPHRADVFAGFRSCA